MAEPEEDDEETTPFDAGTDGEDNDEPVLADGDLPELIDLSEVEATTFELIPRGLYPAVIEEVEYGLSQTSNLPMLTWTFALTYEEKERRLKYWTTLAGDGAGRTKALLATLAPELDLAKLDPYSLDDYFSGAEVMVRVTIRADREDRSLKRNNISAVMLPDEGFQS